MITAKIIKDSIHSDNRLTTLELEYPRYIHPELMSHRIFSRNAQSSRAIPVERMIKTVDENRWYPIFMRNQKGMTASEKLTGEELSRAKHHWREAKAKALRSARDLLYTDVHKQIVNRLLEPFSTIKVVLSSTSFDNFFNLRLAEGAQQEIQELAYKMKEAIDNSTPTQLDIGQWHLPYVREEESLLPASKQVALSAARCARVSYLTHDGIRDLDKDYDLHDQLVSEKHMSPTEHQATPGVADRYYGNFKGWMQYRQHLESNWKLK